ncbi:hypothetical protein APHAL10511_002236 [Amanita phalloides]|nr:hypothetical protein APHAL10511_002236 [Amanita phalloides]
MEARKAEFARLFDLFERLTNRAARKGHAAHMPPNDRKASAEPVHRDIHDPNSVVPITETQHPDTKPISLSSIWPRSAVAGVTGDATSEVSMDSFPIGKWYPFTFRLYELEEWAKKVKDVLERSQKDFKPLSEMDWKKKKQTTIDENRVPLSLKQPEGRGRSGSISIEPAAPRTRNSSASRDSIPSERLHGQSVFTSATLASSKVVGRGDKISGKIKEGARIVKKRCVGRDKIFTKNPSGPEENTWVYNAAAALMDRGGTGEGPKKGSLVSFQPMKTDTADDRHSLAVTNTPPVTKVNAPCKWVFSETEAASHVSSRKRPYLFG